MKKAILAMTSVLVLSSPLIRAQSVDYSPELAGPTLADGFKVEDKAPLHEFLHHWHKESTPTPTNVLAKKPTFEQAVYALYEPFFVPEVKGIDAKYLIVQSDIDVHLVEGDLEKAYREELRTFDEVAEKLPAISKVTIHSFQPKVAVVEKRVLYYKRPYVAAMVQFLAGKEIDIEASWNEPNGFDELDDEHKEQRDRLKYLNSNLQIVPGHWDKGWHFATHPEVICIVLSVKLDKAVVSYRTGYRGGLALLHLQDRKWVVIGRERTWVE